MIPAAAGATWPKVWTCAMTSWRLFFSSAAAISNCSALRCYVHRVRRNRLALAYKKKRMGRTKFAFICSMASSEMGNPSSFSAMARFSHSFRHVWKRF